MNVNNLFEYVNVIPVHTKGCGTSANFLLKSESRLDTSSNIKFQCSECQTILIFHTNNLISCNI